MKKTILILAILLCSTNAIYACACVELKESVRKKIKKALLQSDLIFVGKVTNMQAKETEIYVPELGSKLKYQRVIYTFKLINTINGQLATKEIEIVTSTDSCGMEFQVGETYLVYSKQYDRRIAMSPYLNQEKVNPVYATDTCTRTKKVDKVTEREIKTLERLAKRIT